MWLAGGGGGEGGLGLIEVVCVRLCVRVCVGGGGGLGLVAWPWQCTSSRRLQLLTKPNARTHAPHRPSSDSLPPFATAGRDPACPLPPFCLPSLSPLPADGERYDAQFFQNLLHLLRRQQQPQQPSQPQQQQGQEIQRQPQEQKEQEQRPLVQAQGVSLLQGLKPQEVSALLWALASASGRYPCDPQEEQLAAGKLLRRAGDLARACGVRGAALWVAG